MERIALADGTAVMNFWQAIEAAKKRVRTEDGEVNNERPGTVRGAVETSERDLGARDRAARNANWILKRLPPGPASKPVGAVVRKDIIGFRDEMLATGVKKSTVTRCKVVKAARKCPVPIPRSLPTLVQCQSRQDWTGRDADCQNSAARC
jgi:hypothetical protein